MDCTSFERSLDHDGPAALVGAASAHARRCERCASMLAAALEVDALLAAPPDAPAGFADRVMARVSRVRAIEARAPGLTTGEPLAWWVRTAAEPAVALALVLAGLLLWKRDPTTTLVSTMLASASQWLAGARLPVLPPLWTEPCVILGLAISLAPALVWAALWLYHRSARLAGPVALPRKG